MVAENRKRRNASDFYSIHKKIKKEFKQSNEPSGIYYRK